MAADAVAEWIRSHARPLRTLDYGDDDFADLAPLADLVAGARVVAIGESDHFVHEFLQFRHRAARFLMTELGFEVYALEADFPEGVHVGDWVGGGDADIEDLMWSRISYAFGMSTELREHLAWMRSWNQTHGRRFHFCGVNIPVAAHPG